MRHNPLHDRDVKRTLRRESLLTGDSNKERLAKNMILEGVDILTSIHQKK